MARTPQQIYDALIAEKANYSELGALNSTSQTALWQLWLRVVANIASWHEQLWDAKSANLDNMARITLTGTVQWYIAKIKEFQNGHELAYINEKWQYANIDPDAQIVKRVSIGNIENGLFIKVAGEYSNGDARQLNSEEITNLNAYINMIKIAGTYIELVSLAPDKLSFEIHIWFSGSYSIVRDNVIAAIFSYIKSLPFNGAVTRGNLITAINNVPGTEDVHMVALAYQYGNNQTVTIERAAEPASGYWVLDGYDNDFGEISENPDGSISINNDGNCTLKFIPANV